MGSEVQILPGPPLLADRCWRPSAGALYGGVAQLGEHLLCKQGVVGSIPIASRYECWQVVWVNLGIVTGWVGALLGARAGGVVLGRSDVDRRGCVA